VALLAARFTWTFRAWRQCALASVISLPLCGLFLYATYRFIADPGVYPVGNFGFGPDLQCTKVPNSEPVCIKTR
jgi:hypothetical protein